MAKNKNHVRSGQMTPQDLEYANMLLAYSRYLDTKVVRLEDFEEVYWMSGRGLVPESRK